VPSLPSPSIPRSQEPPEPYPDGKMYFASQRSMPVVPATGKHLWEAAASNQPRDRDSVLRKSCSLGALDGRSVAGRTPAAGNSKAGAGSGGDR
ncbi:unnamed protein product, partial [Ectocarpus sp. 6 AP-2014]